MGQEGDVAITLCGKCSTPEATCGCSLPLGVFVKMVRSPRPETQHVIGRRGVIIGPEQDGIAEACFVVGKNLDGTARTINVLVDRSMVELAPIPVSGNAPAKSEDHWDDALPYLSGSRGGGKTQRVSNTEKYRNQQKLRELLDSGKLFIPSTGKIGID